MHTTDDATMEELAGHLYDSLLEPSAWPLAWSAITRLVPADQVMLGALDPTQGRWAFREMLVTPPRELELLTGRYSIPSTNPVICAFMGQPLGKPTLLESVLPCEEFVRSEVYQEVCRPLDLHQMLHVNLVREPGLEAAWNAYRPRWARPFGTRELARLRQAIPHLQRYVRLRLRLQTAEAGCTAALAALERLDFGLLLLDGGGRVRHANGIARGLLATDDSLRERHHVLHAATADEDTRLQGLVRAVVTTAERRGLSPGGEVLLKRGSRPALRLVVAPVGAGAAFGDLDGLRAMVLIFDPGRIVAPPSRALTELFALTPAESAVAAAIAQGQTPRQTAEALGVERSTVRTHLYRAMDKLGVRTQPDLVRVVLSLFLGVAPPS